MESFRSINLVKIPGNDVKGINRKIQWLSHSLGLFSLRDKEKSCYRIFVELLKASRKQKLLSSDELAYHLNLTRGTVVHHLKRLMDSGLVVHKEGKYALRDSDLSSLVKSIRKDVCEIMDDVSKVAGEIDKRL
jgi:predicted transcriptional regulator